MAADAETTGNASADDGARGAARASAPYPGRILAVDYGEKRIGLAVSDPSRTIATPAGFIVRRAGKRPPIAEIVRRAEAAEATAFVVGLPLDSQGDDTPRAIETRAIAAELEKRTGLPVTLVDERYTTAAALRTVREMGGTTRGRKGDVDALAATILLQHALRLAP
ncbi:MAG: Holliday junction resolvase RuvX [Gemmatimonadota bacterium]|nr:Holliday junction resolvase RuvX [Gemmatimonadota bacterium]